MAVLTWLASPAAREAWDRLGFRTDPDALRVGGVRIGYGSAAVEWGFDELGRGELGVPTVVAQAPSGGPPAHGNGIDRIDHVVYAVPVLDHAVPSIGEVLGLEPRKRFRPREPGPEMAFYRAGEAVIEVVEGAAGPSLWGIAFRTADLNKTVAAVRAAGGSIKDPKPSVQGGRIATVPTDQIGVPVAVMEPPVRG